MKLARDVDPFTFEIIRHKLFTVVDEAVTTLANVSGSPITAEGHDVLVSLYRADGTVLIAGVGFVQHILAAAQAVKHILRNFFEDPGIFEEDVYLANDPYTVAMHTPDIFMIMPIHWKGELVSWVVNFVHVTDIGGIDTGGFCPNARECYHEGFSTKGLKLIERGKLRKDVFETFLNMVRDPGMTALDLKSQIAANHVAKQRMLELFRDYGWEAVDAVGERLIVQSERSFRQRLRELPDGTWRARQYMDLPGKTYRLELTATKKGDSLIYDFTGTDEQAPVAINCCYWATKGGALAPLFPLLAWDLTWNEGIVRCLDVIAPEGSLLNCRPPAPVSIATIGCVQAVNLMSETIASKMLGATEKYKDRATGLWDGASVVSTLGGLNRDGEYVSQMSAEVFGMGEGARSFMDGLDVGGLLENLVLKMPNVEFEELYFPKLTLYRRIVPDTGGPGKYRGGTVHEFAVTPHGSAGKSLKAVLMPGKGVYSPVGQGIFGGYPSSNAAYIQFRESNISELPYSLDSTVAKEKEYARFDAIEIKEGDILYLRQGAGGGYGDPLDRDPELVLKDILMGLITEGMARDVYGVVINLKNKRVDSESTYERRLALRRERLGKKEPEVDVRRRRDIPRTPFRINEYLQLADSEGKAFVQCTWCGKRICQTDCNWKDHVVLRKSLPSRAGPLRNDSGEFFLLEFFCPSCATVLDIDVTFKDDPPLHDKIY